MSNTGAQAEVVETRPYPRELVASLICGVELVGGPELNQLIGYIVGRNPREFVGLHRPHITYWLNAADWLISHFPELEQLRGAPHNLPGARAFLAELELPEVYLVPRLPNAGDWLPPAEG